MKKATKLIKLKFENEFKVENGIAIVTNLDTRLEFRTDLPDGYYHKEMFDKGVVAKLNESSNEHLFEPMKVDFDLKASFNSHFIDLLNTASKFVGKDVLRPMMTGVNIDETGIASTDASVLYFKEVETGIDQSITVPVDFIKILNVINKEVAISVGDTHVKAEFADRTILISKLIVGKYPNYRAVIPTNKSIAIVNRKMFISELNNARYFGKTIDLKFNANTLFFKCKNIDSDICYTNHREVKYKDDKYRVGLSIKYLLSILKCSKSEDAKLTFTPELPSRAVLIDGCYLVMPVTLLD